MKKTNTDKIKYYKYAVIALSIVFVIAVVFFFLKLWEKEHGRFPSLTIEDSYLEYDGKKFELKDNVETFLVLGLDKLGDEDFSDSYNNNKQADFLMLFVLDNDKKTCSALHINRDTMTSVDVLGVAGNRVDTVTKQIALAHTYGNGKEVSCRNTLDSVSKLLLDVKLDHYISLTMDSVPVMNDIVGGVEVEVLDDFTDIDDALVKGEKVTLMGEQALTYVRSRQGLEDSTNMRRMERQRQYIEALYGKSLEIFKNNDALFVEATLKMSDYIVSDRSVTQLQELYRKFSEYELVEISDIEGKTTVGERFMEFYPDSDSLKKTVIELFYEPKD